MANAKSDYVILDSSTISGCEFIDEVCHHGTVDRNVGWIEGE
jgi:hypothetical protein